ncbi:MAG: hypothetical protein P1U61_05030 [Legionellaceae bacterium]|nr:hypothetical protein [Legionellaceae bacterium]
MPEWGILAGVGLIGLSVALYPLRQKKWLFFLLLPIVAACLICAYCLWGGWFQWQAFQLAQQKQREAQQVIQALGSTEAIIERLKARLAETPKDAKAWFLLGRVYVSNGDWQHAYEAYTMAHGLEANNQTYTLHYAQSVWELHQQSFDDKMRELLEAILKDDPEQPDALAMLAYDAYTRHLNQKAVAYWERLLLLTPSPSEDADKIRQAIAKARQ